MELLNTQDNAPAASYEPVSDIVTILSGCREDKLGLFTALVEFAESRGVSRYPESTLTARLEAAAFGGAK